MRAFIITLAFAFLSSTAMAQQAPAPAAPEADKTFTPATDVMALIAKAKADLKPGSPMISGRILHLEPYNVNLEYRVAVGPAAVHEKNAELFYVIDGSGTFTTGGKLVKETRTNAENLTGTGIEGGASRDVAKGDFLIVPQNTPHWVSKINGTLILMSIWLPRPVPGRS